jgi:hypothetical protein
MFFRKTGVRTKYAYSLGHIAALSAILEENQVIAQKGSDLQEVQPKTCWPAAHFGFDSACIRLWSKTRLAQVRCFHQAKSCLG